jgi:23S rRNA pseudouridine1911/1915/1917 synthase
MGMRAPILRAGEIGPSPIWVRQIVHPAGRDCQTRFCVETRFRARGGEIRPRPLFSRNRPHAPIRVHLAHSGHPILGDKLYSGDGSEYLDWMEHGWTPDLQQRLLLPRHALHAAKLALPWHGRRLEWQADLPADLAGFIAGQPYCETPA